MTKELSEEIKQNRHPEHEIDPLILNRWSPRAFSDDEISADDLLKIFEAAKWAPSSFNEQPWRFIYAKKGTEHWDTLFNLMNEFNREWAKNTSILVVVVSKNNFTRNDKPNMHHGFDSGAAWQNLALQATSLGYHAHAMAGIDFEKAKSDLEIPDGYTVQAMVAIGKKAAKETYSEEMLEKEVPSARKELKEIIMEGRFHE
jgi:nitroreductase